jgi:hypothetical protein
MIGVISYWLSTTNIRQELFVIQGLVDLLEIMVYS